jgi:hypothetical protein
MTSPFNIFLLIILLLIIYFYLNNYIECFNNLNSVYTSEYSIINVEQVKLKAYKEVELIKDNYNKLKGLYIARNKNNLTNIIDTKNDIKKSINVIDEVLVSSYDHYKLNNLYYNELIPILDKPDDMIFYNIINDIKLIIDNGINESYNYKAVIKQIRVEFKDLNELYKNIYINKIYTSIEKKNEIEGLTRIIFNLLLKLGSYEKINSLGLVLILNTSLKRSYETNNLTDINSNINSFNEILKKLALEHNVKEDDNINNIPIPSNINKNNIDVSVPASVITPTTSISVKTIKEDFNNIYNSFDLINEIYLKDNLANNKKQIINLNDMILKSLDNIANYDKNNKNYYSNVITIKSVVIKPILDIELANAYKSKSQEGIDKIKNRFYDALVEIKNLILSNYAKTSISTDKNKCLKDVVEAIINNDYPVKISQLKNCDKSLFDNPKLEIQPKLAISKDNGKTWGLATDLYEYKKTGYNSNPYIFSYKLASTTNEGKDWNFITQEN